MRSDNILRAREHRNKDNATIIVNATLAFLWLAVAALQYAECRETGKVINYILAVGYFFVATAAAIFSAVVWQHNKRR